MGDRSQNSGRARLILVSVDGLRADLCRRPDGDGLKIPHLRRLLESGASAEAVETVYPSTTLPAHATLVTGAPPRVHGIYSHLASLDPTAAARPWCWFARALRVPALWDVARASGLKTAAIGWPVTVGASIDYNIPEIWDPAAPDVYRDFETTSRHSTPGLFPEVAQALASLLPDAPTERLRAEAALHIWNKYGPDFLLLHFVEYDHWAHQCGPLSPEALAAVELIDGEIGRLRDAVEGDPRVNFVVLSDHGFVEVENDAAPLVVLKEEGLFEANAGGKPELKKLGAVDAGGSFAVYWLEEPTAEDRRALERAVDRLGSTGAVSEVVDRARLESLDADPDAELMLDAAPGYFFSDRFEGPVVSKSTTDRGTHGHLPTRPGLEASFIAAGPEVASGKDLGRVHCTRVAPTLACLLGLPANVLASQAEPLELG